MIVKIKNFLNRFFLINDTPQKVAAGAALGMFLGIFPGEGLISTLLLSSLFRLNRLAATMCVLAFNTWTTFFVLPLAATVGGFLFRINYSTINIQIGTQGMFDYKQFITSTLLLNVALPLLVGFFIVTTAIALGFYFLLLFFLKRKNIKHLEDKIKIK